MLESILASLNSEQQAAVLHVGSPLLILAGAGSGKTRVLTHRIAYFIEKGVRPEEILAVTFTNKAADVMRSRIVSLIHAQVPVGTFHSACLKILREQSEQIGFPRNFSIYDDQDQLVIVKQCMEDTGLNTEQFSPKGILEAISRAKDDLKGPEQIAQFSNDRYELVTARIYEKYQSTLRELEGMDFGDLLMHTVRLFESRPDILDVYERRFRHIFVDEYQDTNHAQYRFIKILAEKHEQITVVGDPDQSIYAWRGADINNILDFERDFANVKVIKLEQNYRSTSNILDAANGLIQFNSQRKHKNLWSDRGAGELIQLYEAADEKDEARYVIKEVQSYLSAGKNLKEMVVFYRVHAQSRVFEDELRRMKINYRIVGGVRFYDRKEVKDLIAYLRVVHNPTDSLSLKRILNVPPRGFGKKAMELLRAKSEETGDSLFNTLSDAGFLNALSKTARKGVTAFYQMIAECQKMYSEWGITKLLEWIIAKSQYIEILEQDHTLEARMRIENIQEFFSVLEEFEHEWTKENDRSMLGCFLESISLATEIDRWNPNNDMLTLMTLHSAKGLEFPVVFMVGMEEGLFPHTFNGSVSSTEIEEERRLCYVGLTRGMDLVHMSFARSRLTYGVRNASEPSRFLTEIPSAYIELGSECEKWGESETEIDGELNVALESDVTRGDRRFVPDADCDIDETDDPFL